MTYDAFISYSHAADQRLAPRLQAALHGFAKPWYRLRAMHTFRDKTNLAATPTLWGSIQAALDNARYFILLASPEAAASPWVCQEVERWLATKGAQRLLIVITGGALVWDRAAGRFDAAGTTALPEVLHAAFSEEPLHVDLSWAQHASQVSLRDGRFAEAVAQLAATVRGRPLDELAGEDVRQHRILRASAASAVAGLVVLTVASLVGGYLAVQARQEAQVQRDQATYERNVALSRLLASDAERTAAIRPNNQEEAALVAIEAMNRHATVRANQVLRGLADRLLPPYGVHRPGDQDLPMDFSADGAIQAVFETPTTLRILDVASGQSITTITREPPKGPYVHRTDKPVLVANGTHVVAPEAGGWLSVWDTRTGKRAGRHRDGPFVLSPDGHHIAVRASDALLLSTLLGPASSPALLRDEVSTDLVAFSPDSRLLMARAEDGDTHVWRVADRRRLHLLRHAGHGDPAAFSRDSRWLATVGADGVTVWSLADGSRVAHLQRIDARVSMLDFHPDGEHLALASATQNWVAVRSLRTGREVFRAQHDAPLRDLVFSDDGRLLATASVDHTSRVWDWALRAEVARTVHMSQVAEVAFAARGELLITTPSATPRRAWRLQRPVMRHPLGPPGQETHGVDFSPDGKRVAAGGADGVVRILELTTGAILDGPPDHGAFCGTPDDPPGVGLRYSPDGHLLATACGQFVHLWDTQTWAEMARIPDDQSAQRLAFSRDGRMLATGGNRGYVSVYATDSGARLARFEVPGVTWDLGFSSDGRHMVAAGGDLIGEGRAIVWDLHNGRIARTIDHGGRVQAAAFSPDGTQLLTGSSDGVAKLTTLADGVLVATFQHASNVEAVAFDGPGAHAITASDDGGARMWRIADGRLVRELLHADAVTTLALSPDGAYLASGGHDSQAHVWRLADGREMAREELSGPVTRVVFSPGDGRYVAAIGQYYEHPGLVWLWSDDDVRRQALNRVTRTLSPEEWARYLPGTERVDPVHAAE